MNSLDLSGAKIHIKQRFEMAELVGFETRNKYEIKDSRQEIIGFAAERGKGIFEFLMRQMLGHWRTFEVHILNPLRRPCLVCKHPFRLIFQRFEIYNHTGEFLGAIQQRFSILSKRFDIVDHRGALLFEMSSPIYRIWTFPIRRGNFEYARIVKKWTGIGSEAFTDKDNFEVDFLSANLSEVQKNLILAAALFVDIQYFEYKAQ